MEKVIVLLILYTVLVMTDVVPLIKSMNWKPLWFVLLVYAGTFSVQIMMALEILRIDLVAVITKALSGLMKAV
jgi:hypothetical protein